MKENQNSITIPISWFEGLKKHIKNVEAELNVIDSTSARLEIISLLGYLDSIKTIVGKEEEV